MQSQELLKQAHLKVSSARTSILQQLLDARVACSAEHLYLQLHQQQSGLSLATIYRVLTELEQAKLIERQYHQRAKASFVIRQQRAQCQILHLQNGQVEAFEHQDLSNYLNQLADVMQQQLVKVELILHVQPKS
ncbi:Fur family transcriptional regulator [Acinetobacter tandoii]|jgi:Fur family ferric uptake transcriptional regulator|uniref:Fur family transcriptional regulator n=1 Tax=Acinetobacter tandoii TaxID=202954 RepID=UPI00404611F0